ncbi:MAG TPA: molybdenum cofactor guanylyltransferase [bacterium]|nr:molybdenum cofactor guanylyltransferase [bacterium]HPN35398.1 molybdenum cofactor guanylyltransferase [bacterium]
MYDEITGIILAGGKSLRMGQDKALLTVGGQTVIGRIAVLMTSLFAHNLIITNDAKAYGFLPLTVVTDIHPGLGPLGGIHTGLSRSSTLRNLIISCDLPFMNREVIECIIKAPSPSPIVLARACGRLQFFPGLYSKSLLPIIENSLVTTAPVSAVSNRSLSLYTLVEKAQAVIVDVEKMPFYDEWLFFNLNTKADFAAIAKKFSDDGC